MDPGKTVILMLYTTAQRQKCRHHLKIGRIIHSCLSSDGKLWGKRPNNLDLIEFKVGLVL